MYKINKTLVATLALGLLAAGSAFADGTAAAPAKAAAAPAAKPAAAAPAAAPAASTAAKPAAAGSVNKAQFTSAVTNHEPTDNLTTLDNSHTRIYFYCVLNNLQGQEVTFRWSFNDVTQAEVKQTPAYPHYRTQTSKELDPSKLGTWKVEVMDASGNTLASKTFEYTKASGDATAAPAAATKK
ncbi:MAG: DUF2914 domain-containing protein [Bacillota bacterium]